MNFTAADLLVFRTLAERIPEGGFYEPNLYHCHNEFKANLIIANKLWSKDRYPGKFRRLELVRDSHKVISAKDLTDTASSDDAITRFGFFESGMQVSQESFSATGFAAIARGFHTLDLSILVINNESVFAAKTYFAVHDVYGEISVVASLEGNSGDYIILLFGSWDPRDNTAPRLMNAKLTAGTRFLQAIEWGLSAPVQRNSKPLDPGAITIGLGRPYTDQDTNTGMDYAWNQSTQNSPKGMVPFVGHVRFSERIQPLKRMNNFLIEMSVVNTIGGGGYYEIKPEVIDKVYDGFLIDNLNQNLLKWNFTPGSTTDPGSPVVFDKINWPSDMRAIFFCRVTVFLEGGDSVQFIVRSYDRLPTNIPDGTFRILPISFVWHCLAAGTSVLMGDGTQKCIEQIIAGDSVRSDLDSYEPSEVLWTTKGRHDGPVYQIEVTDGSKIVASENHVFVTETGMALARELHLGDSVFRYSATNASELNLIPISKLCKIDGFSEEMYNIAIRTGEQSQVQAGTFFANGFCVGDATADQVLLRMYKKDIGYLKSVIPAIHHKDLDSYFEDFGIC